MRITKSLKLLLLLAFMVILLPSTTSYAKETDLEYFEDDETILIYEENGELAGKIQGNTLFAEAFSVFVNRSEEELAPWYEYSDTIEYLVINSQYPTSNGHILYIGNYAFYGLENLKSIAVPKSILTIGSYAFANCTSLEKAACGDGIYKISDSAFSGCNNLKYVALPNTYFSIGIDNFDYQESITLISYKNGIAEAYANYSGGSVSFVNAENSDVYSRQYYNTKDNEVKLFGNEDSIEWGYNPVTKAIKFTNTTQTPEKITGSNHEWKELGAFVQTAILNQYITGFDSSVFSSFTNLTSITLSPSTSHVDENALVYCSNLKEIVVFSYLNNIFDETFFATLPAECEIICHYSENEKSLFQTALKAGVTVSSFEGTERLESIKNDVSCANQFDGIRNISARGYYYDDNGNKVSYTKTWASTACVVTSTAMMIERKAYLEGYEANEGSYDQKTVAAIVKEISYEYELVNYSWEYIWGKHTTSYETLTKDGENYTVTVNSLDKSKIKEDVLLEYLDAHPEGVAVFNGRHAVLVIDYNKADDGKITYTVWDPATGDEHERSLSNLNGNKGFVLKHIIYVED